MGAGVMKRKRESEIVLFLTEAFQIANCIMAALIVVSLFVLSMLQI